MLRRGPIIILVLIVAGFLALPASVGNAHHEAQTCPDDEGDADNKHPSGKDRHCEPGGSRTQGSAKSDPDDDGRGPDRSNGGLDQEGGPGGEDHADQDGNNGCGNDDDFEDDNEGLCLGRQGAQPSSTLGEQVSKGGETVSRRGAQERRSQSDIGGSGIAAPEETEVLGGEGETSVLGAVFTRPFLPPTAVLGVELVRGAALAATGIPMALLGLLALGLITAGTVARQTARRRTR